MATTELFSTAGNYGLEILADAENARADIVFVHGLTGNRENTWTHKPSKVFWPKDLLPHDVERTRIMTFGYDANIVSAFDTASSNTLRDHGKSLANDLAARRTRTDSETRPLIFVAHGLGGLVVEQALLISHNALQPRTQALLEATHGIVFMGTPHMGSDLAQWGGMLGRFSGLFRRTNAEITRVLEPGSEMLAYVQQEFHTLLNARAREQRKKVEIFCFYEEVAVLGVGLIVPKHSAILTAYENASIHATHTDMTKFAAKNDAGYVRVSDQLFFWLRDLAAAAATQMSVAEVRHRRFECFAQPQSWSAPVNSGSGGVIVQGNASAGGDYNLAAGK